MKVYFEEQEEEKEIKFNGVAEDLLKQLNINPITVILVKNNKLISKKEQLSNKDSLKILSVISGG
ncbi:MAG: hypothetical protein MAG795_01043 [Candidatus Woesearchaeota archaeon]|nr:hypothetical protein [Candidatus Woesearchaeota archaeon]